MKLLLYTILVPLDVRKILELRGGYGPLLSAVADFIEVIVGDNKLEEVATNSHAKP